MNNLSFPLVKLVKEEKLNLKAINEIEHRKTVMNESKCWLFEMIKEIDNPPSRFPITKGRKGTYY